MIWPSRRTRFAMTSRLSQLGPQTRQMMVHAWSQAARSARRWAIWGAALGAFAGLVAFAPAAWLAQGLHVGSDGRLLLADARGTVWSGSAVPVLTAGAGSRDAAALPGRLHWALGWRDGAAELRLQHACCLRGEQVLRLHPGFGRLRVELPASPEPIGQWPAGWLAGLGTPWNTLQLDGELILRSGGLNLESVQGRWRIDGRVTLLAGDIASRISTLPVLGSYRLEVIGDADGARLNLATQDGALRLQGSGQWAGQAMRFRGDARAEPGSERALDNLLNIIGRRTGELSLISIG